MVGKIGWMDISKPNFSRDYFKNPKLQATVFKFFLTVFLSLQWGSSWSTKKRIFIFRRDKYSCRGLTRLFVQELTQNFGMKAFLPHVPLEHKDLPKSKKWGVFIIVKSYLFGTVNFIHKFRLFMAIL